MLSLKGEFVAVTRRPTKYPGSGNHWTLDMSVTGKNKRMRKRRPRGSKNIIEEYHSDSGEVKRRRKGQPRGDEAMGNQGGYDSDQDTSSSESLGSPNNGVGGPSSKSLKKPFSLKVVGTKSDEDMRESEEDELDQA